MDTETLLRYIPNYIAPGMGEAPLIDKIAPFIEAAELWTNVNIASEEFVSGNETLQQTRDNIIAARAIYLAAPALDVTMHPNGLAVVNTDSIAPASAERSREFRRALDRQVIARIDFFLHFVFCNELLAKAFINTAPAASLWCNTIFYNHTEIISYTDIDYSCDAIINAITKLSDIENEAAEKFISFPLLQKWRTHKDLDDFSPLTGSLIRSLKSVIGNAFKSGINPDFFSMSYIVENIRSHPDLFPEWHRSDTAKLFSPQIFHNSKSSGGYFF